MRYNSIKKYLINTFSLQFSTLNYYNQLGKRKTVLFSIEINTLFTTRFLGLFFVRVEQRRMDGRRDGHANKPRAALPPSLGFNSDEIQCRLMLRFQRDVTDLCMGKNVDKWGICRKMDKKTYTYYRGM